ncbi:MAG: dihydrolipoamide acetyltransferase family protein [Clostridiaceae bacterium]|nr:dihydrolipoamide acetyltransferase family protein [Clostridiaceae bacterium]
MATPVIMPRQGQSVESCILAKWAKAPGDAVAEGDLLFSYETDKAGFEEYAKVSGTLLAVFAAEGDDIPCLQNVCVIGNPGEDVSAFAPGGEAPAAPAEAAAPAAEATAAPEAAAAPTAPAEPSAVVFASPRARHAAEKAGVDLRYATPTGPNGRVIERDVDAARAAGIGLITSAARAAGLDGAAGAGIGGRMTTAGAPAEAAAPAAAAPAAPAASAAAPAPEFEDVKIPNIRKVISKAMHNSLSEMAQLTYNTSFDATAIMGYRAKIKANMERLGLENITLNDIILFVVSRTLMMPEHRDFNANFLNGDTMRYFTHVNLGVAVDTPRGLMVPTIFNADQKSLNEIAAEVKSLAKQCKGGAINPDLLKGGSFTVSNLGNMGIESFTPVINPPQTAILGVDTVAPKVRPAKDGGFEFYQSMGLSLTCDHRVIDGTPSAKFLKDLCANLESFDVLLAK